MLPKHPLLIGQALAFFRVWAFHLHCFPRPFSCRPVAEQLHHIAFLISQVSLTGLIQSHGLRKLGSCSM